jgi:Domain of unknown function (DUF4157)
LSNILILLSEFSFAIQAIYKTNRNIPSSNLQSFNRKHDPYLRLQQQLGNRLLQRLIGTGRIQTKHMIGKSGDNNEKEADRVADLVVGGSMQSGATTYSNPDKKIRRKPKSLSDIMVSADPVNESGIINKSGSALDADTQESMERSFGYNLGKVRLHTDKESDRLARNLNASAFTVGTDIAFAEGYYSPNPVQTCKW